MEITRDMLISDVIRAYPEAIQVLMQNGMSCIGWPGSQMESLEEAAMVHGLDIEKLMKELNA